MLDHPKVDYFFSLEEQECFNYVHLLILEIISMESAE